MKTVPVSGGRCFMPDEDQELTRKDYLVSAVNVVDRGPDAQLIVYVKGLRSGTLNVSASDAEPISRRLLRSEEA